MLPKLLKENTATSSREHGLDAPWWKCYACPVGRKFDMALKRQMHNTICFVHLLEVEQSPPKTMRCFQRNLMISIQCFNAPAARVLLDDLCSTVFLQPSQSSPEIIHCTWVRCRSGQEPKTCVRFFGASR
jgi:hypothetical protein